MRALVPVYLYAAFFCLSLCLTVEAAWVVLGLLGERNYRFVTGFCDLSLLIFQSVYRTVF